MTRISSRQRILNAAERLFIERGAAATLECIATAADVSKGGLLYHFPSKETLRTAVCQQIVDRLWRAVHGLLPAGPPQTGDLLRAYVRALTGDSDEAARVFMPTALPQLFDETPGAVHVLRDDAARWRDAFAADGIGQSRSLVIRHSAEGAATAAAEGYIQQDELRLIRHELLTMTRS